jgi:hypothetical protein
MLAPRGRDCNADRRTRLSRHGKQRLANATGKRKLYALHAPEVKCIGKGKARSTGT